MKLLNINQILFTTFILISKCHQGHLVSCQRFIDPILSQSNFSYDSLHSAALIDQIEQTNYPLRSLMTREAINIDSLFDFCLDLNQAGFASQWYDENLVEVCPTKQYYKMPVPSSFNDITSERIMQDHIGWVWYQVEIELPKSYRSNIDQQMHDILLNFEAANYFAIVYGKVLNSGGRKSAQILVTHVGGHLPFVANLTSMLLSKSNIDSNNRIQITIALSNLLTENTIPSGSLVDISNVVGYPYSKFEPDFDFFHFAGLIGSVKLIRLPKLYWSHVNTEYNTKNSNINFKACLSEGQLDSISNYSVDARVVGPCFDSRSHAYIRKYSDFESDECFSIKVKPSPSLCKGQSLVDMNSLILVVNQIYPNNSNSSSSYSTEDKFEHNFSCLLRRRLDINANNSGLFELDLNNSTITSPIYKRVKLQGFGMHHEQLFSGRTMSQAAILKDLYLVKSTGANVIRTSHYPYSSAYLDACDQLGISVIAECQAVGLRSFNFVKLKLHKQLVHEMYLRDHWHPSIIAWSIANEPLSNLKVSEQYFGELIEYCKEKLKIDLPITGAIAQNHDTDYLGQFLDLIMINRYFAWYDHPGILEAIKLPLLRTLKGWAQMHPGKALIVSEYGAESLAGLHSQSANMFSEEFQAQLIERHQVVFEQIYKSRSINETLVNLIGSMVWNFAEFSTHNSITRVAGNRKGVFSRDRSPKLAAKILANIYARN